MILLKSAREIEHIRESCGIAAKTLEMLRGLIEPGITTGELDREAECFILEAGAKPAFKGYLGYPGTICTSLNEEVVHAIPTKKRRLADGDILSIDVGTVLNGYYGDMAVTLPVGTVSEESRRLMEVTERCLKLGVEKARAGNRIGDISWAVQKEAEDKGFSVVKAFVGHGVGKKQHEEPQIPNYGLPGRGPKLKVGMVLAIEPMINAGGGAVMILADKWTAVTVDKSLSAHFEHTVAITKTGPQILTTIG